MLGKAVDTPERPFIAIIGGAKVSDKIAVVDNLLKKADKVIVGGGMAYTFMAAKKERKSEILCLKKTRSNWQKEYMEKAGDKLVLPVDNIIADKFAVDANTQICEKRHSGRMDGSRYRS